MIISWVCDVSIVWDLDGSQGFVILLQAPMPSPHKALSTVELLAAEIVEGLLLLGLENLRC